MRMLDVECLRAANNMLSARLAQTSHGPQAAPWRKPYNFLRICLCSQGSNQLNTLNHAGKICATPSNWPQFTPPHVILSPKTQHLALP